MRATLTIPVWRGLWLALLFSLAIAAHDARAADPDWPVLTGHVVDDAGLLSADQRSGLEAKLAEFQSSWGSQLVVVTVKSLQGLTIEEYGLGLGRHWGIGQVGKNDGAMLIVAPNDRAVRIEVGYGLEGVLTDAICSSIIQSDILPAFRAGRMGEGIVAGTDSILTALSGDYTPSQWADADTGLPAASNAPPPQPTGDPNFPFWLVPLIFVLFWLAIVMLLNRFRGKGGMHRSGWSSGRPSRSFGFSGFSSSSGSGFSGGGGSFGGGGSSGRW
jgi:uncharacterized protein